MGGVRVERRGTLRFDADLLFLDNEAEKMAIVIPPGSFAAIAGERATVLGKLHRLPGPQDLIIADTIINGDNVPR
ncbi:hypothetical protein [Sphingopyxis sp. SE2]|uniref:hypothetical protein n=1 Tax=Sphingopyxis sp. SE2 TaxID=1586240 RepID=UPI0028C45E40|nr:hypothetical protein [Sphingopyxis sp. SE2]